MTSSPNRDAKRAELTQALADIVLKQGIDALSLRPAAAQLGTSDRMLLYYFSSKAALMTDVLACLTDRFGAWLDAANQGSRIAPNQMIGHAVALISGPDARPYLIFWLEIAARAARGDEHYKPSADAIAERWNSWIVATVEFPPGVASRGAAAMMQAIVTGIALLDATAPEVAAAARSRVQT